MMEQLLKANEVAQILSVSKSYVYLLINRGQIPSLRMGKACRVRPKDLETFIASNIFSTDNHPVSLQTDS